MNVVDLEVECVEKATRAFLEMAEFYNAACAADARGDLVEGDRLAALGADAEKRAKAHKAQAVRYSRAV